MESSNSHLLLPFSFSLLHLSLSLSRMWIYSFLSSHLSNLLLGPIEAPPSLPAAPSASNPSPYQFPVLDPSSTEHNPLSYVETRPVGTYLKKKTLKMEQEEEEDYRRRLKEKRNPKRLGPSLNFVVFCFSHADPNDSALIDRIRRRRSQPPNRSTFQTRSSTSARRNRESVWSISHLLPRPDFAHELTLLPPFFLSRTQLPSESSTDTSHPK